MSRVTGLLVAVLTVQFVVPPTLALAAQPVAFRVVALDGDSAPGTAETFGLFHDAVINAVGTVVFSAGVSPTNSQQGIWKSPAGGALAAVAIDGDLAPGGSPVDTWLPGTVAHVDDQGGVAFRADVVDGPTIPAVFGPDGLGGVRRIVDSSQAPPGLPPGPAFAGFANLAHGPSGDTAIEGLLALGGGVDATNFRGVWLAGEGAVLELMVRDGDPAPAAIPGAVIEGLFEPNFGPSQALVGAVLEIGVGGVVADDAVTIWGMAPLGAPALRFRSSTLPPPADTTPLIGAQVLSESDAGELMFTGSLDTPGLLSGLMGRVDAAGVLDIVALSNDPTPGIPGHFFAEFRAGSESLARIAPDGSIVFVATYKNATNLVGEGVWKRDSGGTLELVVRTGAQAPDFDPGVTFAAAMGGYAINRHGDLAFSSTLTPIGTNAIFFYPREGTPQVVVGAGDFLEVAPGDSREVTGISLPSAKPTRSYLNDRRELTFKAVYRSADGLSLETGVFVAQIAPPSVAATGGYALWSLATSLLVLGLLTLRRTRRRSLPVR